MHALEFGHAGLVDGVPVETVSRSVEETAVVASTHNRAGRVDGAEAPGVEFPQR
ncbi:MAG: hypothetical protein ACK4R3_09900 [Aliihoeflea sp.]